MWPAPPGSAVPLVNHPGGNSPFQAGFGEVSCFNAGVQSLPRPVQDLPVRRVSRRGPVL